MSSAEQIITALRRISLSETSEIDKSNNILKKIASIPEEKSNILIRRPSRLFLKPAANNTAAIKK